MAYTLSARKHAEFNSLHIAVTISGTISISVLPPITVQGSGGYDRKVVSELSQVASEYASVMLPSGLGPAVGYFPSQGSNNTFTAYIDCNSWTKQLQQVFDSNSLRWTTPVSYSILPITSILGMPELFDADLRPLLPAIKAAVTKFIESCAYSSSAALSIMQDPRAIDACKTVSSKCVVGELILFAKDSFLPQALTLPNYFHSPGSYRPPASNGSCITCFRGPSSPPNGPNVSGPQ